MVNKLLARFVPMITVWRNLPVLWVSLATGATFGLMLLGLAVGATVYVDATKPAVPIIFTDWPGDLPYALEPRVAGGYWLRFHFKMDPAHGCKKTSQHMLFAPPKSPGGRPEYYPLASTISGETLSGTLSYNYNIRLLIPIDLTGDWKYVYRAQFRCWPFGLITHDQSTAPIDIPLP